MAEFYLPYPELTNVTVNDASKWNENLKALETGINDMEGPTGMQGPTGAYGGPPGETGIQGIQGTTGLANFIIDDTFPAPPAWNKSPLMYWDISDEILYFWETGAQAWVDISSGCLKGTTGVQGDTGLINFIDEDNFPVTMDPVQLHWNRTDEALYMGSTGYGDHWIQISAGALGGDTGVQGETGAQGYTGLQGATGAQGYTGIRAATGAQGYTGAQGHTGAQGYTGLQGAQGAQGVTGRDGSGLSFTGLIALSVGSEDWISTGSKMDLEIPQDITTNKLTVFSTETGFLSFSHGKANSYAAWPSTSWTSKSNFLNNQIKNSSTETVNYSAGDIMRIRIDSVTGIHRVNFSWAFYQ